MLGFTAQNNDVYIYLENDEITHLPKDKIKGTYINMRDPKKQGPLELFVDETINDILKTNTKKDDSGFVLSMVLLIKERVYQQLQARGHYCLHEGYRHVNIVQEKALSDVEKLDFRQLKYYESMVLKAQP